MPEQVTVEGWLTTLVFLIPRGCFKWLQGVSWLFRKGLARQQWTEILPTFLTVGLRLGVLRKGSLPSQGLLQGGQARQHPAVWGGVWWRRGYKDESHISALMNVKSHSRSQSPALMTVLVARIKAESELKFPLDLSLDFRALCFATLVKPYFFNVLNF